MDKIAEDLKNRAKTFAVAIIEFVDDLPKTVTGKIRKNELRELR